MGVFDAGAVICVVLAGFLFLFRAPKQGAKAIGAAVVIVIMGQLLHSLGAIWDSETFASPKASFWTLLLGLPLAVLFFFLLSIRILQFILAKIYGYHVSVRITAQALLGTFRALGRLLGFVLSIPARLFSRRQNLDELLRDWRRG